MARIIGPSCRLCRREGDKLFLKGYRCQTDKCAVTKRQVTPGQHGASQKRKKTSNYEQQLRMKQRVKRIYGVLEKQFKNYFKAADRSKGVTGEILLQLLERRVDNAVFRASFAESRARARQLVRHRYVKVNGRKVDVPSYQLKAGDAVELVGTDAQIKTLKEVHKSLEDRLKPDWMDIDSEKLTFKVKSLPARKDVDMAIQENLIVELYSK
ncbi:MAG: 30S ribosomal protein S4 [Candidatus Omnitrophica bacterium]|nr:30S ribosomal protein S4 [Candidatus Omnitrophota bacterium]